MSADLWSIGVITYIL